MNLIQKMKDHIFNTVMEDAKTGNNNKRLLGEAVQKYLLSRGLKRVCDLPPYIQRCVDPQTFVFVRDAENAELPDSFPSSSLVGLNLTYGAFPDYVQKVYDSMTAEKDEKEKDKALLLSVLSSYNKVEKLFEDVPNMKTLFTVFDKSVLSTKDVTAVRSLCLTSYQIRNIVKDTGSVSQTKCFELYRKLKACIGIDYNDSVYIKGKAKVKEDFVAAVVDKKAADGAIILAENIPEEYENILNVRTTATIAYSGRTMWMRTRPYAARYETIEVEDDEIIDGKTVAQWVPLLDEEKSRLSEAAEAFFRICSVITNAKQLYEIFGVEKPVVVNTEQGKFLSNPEDVKKLNAFIGALCR